MAPPLTPYTFIQCPCADPGGPAPGSPPGEAGGDPTDDDGDDRTFDPRAPRSNFSLYPLEYLLYCEDCHQIRCPRCVAEEIVTYYCPSCLFEVPGSNLKSEGNRCTRSCFQCPLCTAPLSVTSLESPPDPNLLVADNAAAPGAPFVLNCSYCCWSSAEIGIKFDKSNGIYAQLQKLRNGGTTRLTAKERKERRKEAAAKAAAAPPPSQSDTQPPPPKNETLDVEAQFDSLKAFYQNQLSEASSASSGGLSSLGDLGFSSPGSLARIMSLYSGDGLHSRRSKARAGPMREARDSDEGLQVADLDADAAAIDSLRRAGWDGTSSLEQLAAQPGAGMPPGEPHLYGRARLASELRPVPVLLRTKRSKRCPVCRHIISKPEAKVQTTRFRIRLVAGSYIPSIAIRPLHAPSLSRSASMLTISSSASSATAAAAPPPTPGLLQPYRPAQYILTFKNPIFEPVKVTLATPATTPGRFASTVTVLCPQFEIDANTDVWDEALKDGDGDRRRLGGGGAKAAAMAAAAAAGGGADEGYHHQAEAGKVWERGRNWVSVVVEVVPAALRLDGAAAAPLGEDEDVLEIPMLVRVEWEAEGGGDEISTAPVTGKDKDAAKEKRELAYWCVLGIGRISQE